MSAPEGSGTTPNSSAETSAQPPEARVDPTVRFTPGTLLAGRYRIIAPLGKGGMGEVYRADDIRLGQPVALKFLPAALAADAGHLERLKDEVSIGRQISHPNVCRLYDIAEAEGHHFLVMEYVDGEDLASLLRRIGRLPGDKALEIARDVCAGLAAAHDKGVIHRDLKPANVMIDGRGHARIADFGLATPAGTGRAAGLAGTIAYMAPEQLAGEAASLRSDVFSLGLVLYEMFTGRRAFEAKSFDEFRALYAAWKAPSLSSSAHDIDPAVERVILRCLARDPAERPASARAVQAALPGGDPLQAALLAGETPSPEMVTAATQVGDFRPAVAWACLVAALLGLLALPIVYGRVMVFRRAPLPKSPETLADRARDVLLRLGYREPAGDSVFGFTPDSAFLDHVRQLPQGRWEKLGTTRPGPLLFYYRESPRALVSTSWVPQAPWEGPSELGRVEEDDPPLNVPGMTRVVLDPRGRLTRFEAVPPRFELDPGPGSGPDWSPALTEAGFDPARLQPSATHWAAPADSDRKAAWDGVMLDQPDVPFHIEAAAYRGRLVYFEAQGPWVRPPRATPDSSATVVAVVLILVLCFGVIVPTGAVLVRRNLRLGRGDRKGALRLGTFTFATLTLANLFRADHTTSPVVEYSLLVQIASQGFYGALSVWLLYLALEPAVRRRWPQMLISWNRLLAGRFRDPMLGRDVLVGALAGMAVALAMRLDLPSVLLGREPGIPASVSLLSTLGAPRQLAYFFFLSPCLGVAWAVLALFMLYVFHAVVRRTWLARLLLFLVFVSPMLAEANDPLRAFVQLGIAVAIVVAVLVRFGLLASATLWFTFLALLVAPLTLDWSAWYAGRSFALLGFFAAMLVAAFYTSLGGKPLFGRAMLED